MPERDGKSTERKTGSVWRWKRNTGKVWVDRWETTDGGREGGRIRDEFVDGVKDRRI